MPTADKTNMEETATIKQNNFLTFITGNGRRCGMEVVLLPVFPRGFYHSAEHTDLKFPQHRGNDY